MADPAFPRLHIPPAHGWLNDPNGLCRVGGRYHVFFQHNPDSAAHGAICWGHVSSTDLLSWTEHPLALRPRADAAGCWSGCVVDDAGVPTAVYTAVPDVAEHAVVALARSDRTLLHWTPDLVPGPGAPVDGSVEQVRDPFVVTVGGHRYAVQGAGSRSGPPRLLLHGCDDLRAWVPLGTLLDTDDPVAAAVAPAQIWECPNLVEVDGSLVLLVSLWRWVDGAAVLSGVRYLLGVLETDGPALRFRPRSGGVLDEGPACYAPQVLADGDRRLLWGWAWELDRSPTEVAAAGWAGVLTFPRELGLGTDAAGEEVLVVRPAAELVGLRTSTLPWTPDRAVREPAFELVATGPVRLLLERDGRRAEVVTTAGTPAAPARVLVDGSLVETFAAGRCRTDRAYPDEHRGWFVEAARAQVVLHRLGRPDGAGI